MVGRLRAELAMFLAKTIMYARPGVFACHVGASFGHARHFFRRA